MHLRGDSVPVQAARRLAPSGFLIGRSVHAVDEAVDAGAGADYLIAGHRVSVRIEGARRAVAGRSKVSGRSSNAVGVPVLAIGGMSGERIAEVASAGAAGIAAIGLFAGVTR